MREYPRGGWPRLGFTVANNTSHNQVWVVHDSAKGRSKGVAQLAALVNCAGCLGIDVANTHTSVICRHIDTVEIFYLGKPPGTEKRVMRLKRPSLFRGYSLA